MISLGNLEEFLHNDTDHIPFLVKIGIVHAQFETIHPFLDGNGRIGRLLIAFLLCDAGIMKWPCLYLSHHFKKYKSEYYTRLQDTREKGDWEGWIKFFLRGVSDVAQKATTTASKILEVREDMQRRISGELSRAGAGNALTLLPRLFYRTVVSVQQVSEIINTTYATANYLVADLVRIGILIEITGWGRNRKFRFSPYLDLFIDHSEEAPAAA
jgi:Fic family protein